MISRSLHEPGSDSSALMTRKDGRPSFDSFGMKLHFMPVGKPAPPRPRSPDCFISSMIASGPRARSSLVSAQSPRWMAASMFHGWKP
jgi:hypothetical protein